MAETVFEAFMATAQAAPDNVFLCAPPAAGRAYHPDGVELTYGQTRDAVLALREAYAQAGYGHGHRVALLLENRPEFSFHYLALNALGVGIVPINPDYRHDEMLYQMEHCEAELAVVIGSRVAELAEPDREVRRAVLARQLELEKIPAEAALLDYLADRPADSVRSVGALLQRVVTGAGAQGQPVTAGLAREILEGQPARGERRTSGFRTSGIVVSTAGGVRSREKMVWDWPDAADRVMEDLR